MRDRKPKKIGLTRTAYSGSRSQTVRCARSAEILNLAIPKQSVPRSRKSLQRTQLFVYVFTYVMMNIPTITNIRTVSAKINRFEI